jgi:hypothetical protein
VPHEARDRGNAGGDRTPKSSFWKSVVSKSLAESESSECGAAEQDDAMLDKAFERALLPRKVKQLKEQFKSLKRRSRVHLDVTVAIIAAVKRDNPDSIERICKVLDRKKVPLREKWGAEFSSWHSAWVDKKFRNRVKRYISGISPAGAQK